MLRNIFEIKTYKSLTKLKKRTQFSFSISISIKLVKLHFVPCRDGIYELGDDAVRCMGYINFKTNQS